MDDTTTDTDDVFLANAYNGEPSHHLIGECSRATYDRCISF